MIIPLKTSYNPYGFLSKFQAIKINTRNVIPACQEIIELISKLEEFKFRFQKNLITSNEHETLKKTTSLQVL